MDNYQSILKNLILQFVSPSNPILDGESLKEYEKLRDSLHYNLTLDQTIDQLKESFFIKFPDATNSEFIDWFVSAFHNSWLIEHCSVEIKDRNQKVYEAYLNLLETLNRTQSWLKEDKLRTRIEILWQDRGGSYNLLHHTVTIFCDIALACNQKGEYYISYNLDYRCQEMIGKFFTNTLLRRIYEFTMDDLEPYLNLNSLQVDESDNFTEALKESRDNEFVKASLVPKT
ncbi:hypothetical protein [Sphingobacterium mizutaii]|uniref:hypothetical protein n=1 Tax=Sphingobacterium mizutaii TaxID=1010 RepID=UPI00162ABB8F|nr:hypothetical protein [Sphingobacterium mizutaii]